MSKWFAVVALGLATPQVALAEQFAVTPNGANEVDFPGAPADAIAKLANRCIDVKFQVTSSSNTTLVCEAALSMGQSIVGQLLMGNSYSTPPRRFLQFNASQTDGYTRVQGSGWMELQMAFGQIKRNDLSGSDFSNSILGFMTAAGGQLPVGTTFPNHAVMGVMGRWSPNRRQSQYTAQQIAPGSSAEAAGIQAGDVITRIAGKAVGNENDLLTALGNAAKLATYEVEFVRGGKTNKVTLNRAFRPAITKLEFPNTPSSAPTAPTSTAPASVADELAKLAKLRDQGILTNEEFEAQKKKLLGL